MSLLPLLALVALSPAAVDGPSYTAHSTLVTALDPSLAIYSTPRGVGYDGVAGLLIEKEAGTFLCTGSLVGSGQQHVVTAAHCLQDATSVQSVFFPPSGGTIVRTTSAFEIHADYTGAVIDENDIGVIDLGVDGAITEIDGYSLFTGDALGHVYNEVGFGISGTGNTGWAVPAGTRRQGLNRFDFAGTDPLFTFEGEQIFGNQNVLFADFDNGLAAQDASCRLSAFFTLSNSGYCDLGLGALEAGAAPGDSGGPLFVNGQLAAVASFGLTFGPAFGDIDGELNSTFGEFGGFVPISAHTEWLQQRVSVPEPAAILLVLTGLFAIAALRRRRSLHEA